MPHLVVESDAFSASVTVPDPGEPVKAANVENAVQPIANRSKNHEAHGFFDIVKLAAGNALTYLVSAAGIIRLSVGGKIQSLGASGASATNLDGWFERNGMMFRSGNGARERLRTVLTGDVSNDITVAFDVWFLPVPSGNHTRTLRTDTPADLQVGEMIRIVKVRPTGFAGLFSDTIVSQSGQTVFIFGASVEGALTLIYGPKIGGGNDWLPIGWQNLDGVGTGLWGM